MAYRVTNPAGLWVRGEKHNNYGDVLSEAYYRELVKVHPEVKDSFTREAKTKSKTTNEARTESGGANEPAKDSATAEGTK